MDGSINIVHPNARWLETKYSNEKRIIDRQLRSCPSAHHIECAIERLQIEEKATVYSNTFGTTNINDSNQSTGIAIGDIHVLHH